MVDGLVRKDGVAVIGAPGAGTSLEGEAAGDLPLIVHGSARDRSRPRHGPGHLDQRIMLPLPSGNEAEMRTRRRRAIPPRRGFYRVNFRRDAAGRTDSTTERLSGGELRMAWPGPSS